MYKIIPINLKEARFGIADEAKDEAGVIRFIKDVEKFIGNLKNDRGDIDTVIKLAWRQIKLARVYRKYPNAIGKLGKRSDLYRKAINIVTQIELAMEAISSPEYPECQTTVGWFVPQPFEMHSIPSKP